MSLLDFFDHEEDEHNQIYRLCNRCKKEKPLNMFQRNRAGHDNRCRDCKLAYQKELETLRKSGKVRPMPTHCECCGRENPKNTRIDGMGINLALDHHYDDDGNPFFRGWLCRQCNSDIGYLGDNIEGVFDAVDYLLKTLPENKYKKFFSMIKFEKSKTRERLTELNGGPIQRCDPIDTTEQKKRPRKRKGL